MTSSMIPEAKILDAMSDEELEALIDAVADRLEANPKDREVEADFNRLSTYIADQIQRAIY